MLFRDITTVNYEKHTEHINTSCRKNSNFFQVKESLDLTTKRFVFFTDITAHKSQNHKEIATVSECQNTVDTAP